MRISRSARFGLSVTLVTLGCWMLVSGVPSGLATICFTAPTVLLLTRQQATQRFPVRALWPLLGLLLAFVGVVILLRWVVPDGAGDHFLRHPATAVCFWVLMMTVLLLRWRRERSTAGA